MYEDLVSAIAHIDAAIHKLESSDSDEAREVAYNLNDERNHLNDMRLEVSLGHNNVDDLIAAGAKPRGT